MGKSSNYRCEDVIHYIMRTIAAIDLAIDRCIFKQINRSFRLIFVFYKISSKKKIFTQLLKNCMEYSVL